MPKPVRPHPTSGHLQSPREPHCNHKAVTDHTHNPRQIVYVVYDTDKNLAPEIDMMCEAWNFRS